MKVQEAVGWLDLLDVALGYVDSIRQNMNSGVPATSEQFDALNAEFHSERERVGHLIAAMQDTENSAGAAVAINMTDSSKRN